MKNKKEQVAVGVTTEIYLPTLEEIQAKKDFSKFGSVTLDDYEAKISRMSEADLTSHASKIGFRANGNRRMLIINLTKAFETKARIVERIEAKTVEDHLKNISTPEVRSDTGNTKYDEFVKSFRK